MLERWRERARRVIAELMTVATSIRLDDVEPSLAALELHRNAVAVGAGAGKFRSVRRAEHREPIVGRIVLGRRRGVGRRHGPQIESLAGLSCDFWRIDERVAAHPDLVAGLGEIRD